MAKNYVRENVPLSRFGVLVAQLESIVASAAQQPPDALLCFDLLSDLLSAIDEEPKESILLWQRKCEDALYSLLILGARRPVRHLASLAMARIILKGDPISIYSRASSLQGFLADGKRSEPLRVAGAAQCLGELYHLFGRRITSGLLETTVIATKLMKFHEDFVRQEALQMLQNALEGCGGNAASTAYTEAFRLIMRFAVGDKSITVRIAAARCLKAFANIGGPGLGIGELDHAASYCVKAVEDPVSSVRNAFAEALGMVLALAMNPEAQVQPRGKGQSTPAKKLEGGLQRHLSLPFMKASGVRSKDIRIGITLSWVFFLQAIRLRFLCSDSELQNFGLQVMDMLRADTSPDTQALACVLYILRVGVTNQMTEPTQRSFLVFLAKTLQSPDVSPYMEAAALRTLSYTLKTLGEVPLEFKEVLDNTVVASVSHSSQLVRIEAALTLRALAEVDPNCVGGLISYGVTTLNALRDSVSFEKGSNLKFGLDSLHGQATVLAALVSISPRLPLGYPARLPLSVLEVSKKMLSSASRNPIAAAVEEEAGWLLLSSILASMQKEELEDQVFDILSLWAPLFSGNLDYQLKQAGDLTSRVCVWSAAIDALTAFVRCFLSPKAINIGILLLPVVFYLSRALSYISFVAAKELPDMKPAMNMFIIRTLMAYQSLPDPLSYKSDHPQIIQLCTTPFRDASGCEESSCLRLLLDKRDSWLGPWVPGRDWFEDELRAFHGGKDGLMPCVWENELCSFPQTEPISNTMVNQMLLCFGIMFASQDNGGMLSLLGMIEQCLKAGKKQPWHAASVTNICVGLLAGLKALLALRPQPLGLEILSSAQTIFQSILAEGDISASQRRASSEGLGLLARLGNDIFTARMARGLLGDITVATDLTYAGSVALALGCIHRSAGGMALSTLVPSTVSSISLLARSSVAGLQIWSLHGLLLIIEAAGLSFVSQVQATLGLALDILLSEENGGVDLHQGVGRLVNAIVAVLGPELSPSSIFFSRCKSVIAEISSCQETATLLESVRFTQQLVVFAPQAVTVHSHVQILLRTLSSRQPTLRHLAVSTLRHLIEKDPISIIDEQIEANLFHMLDEETDSEIGNLVRSTITRLLYASCPICPFHWISILRDMALATSTGRHAGMTNNQEHDGATRLDIGEDDENMVSSTKEIPMRGYAFDTYGDDSAWDKHLRYRTRVFAAECLSHLPTAVGQNPAHFDLCLARKQPGNGKGSGDWLVLHVQELISLAYQISTIQFENMQPIGVGLLSAIMDKFEKVADPELPGHILLEQYQAQLVSAVRTALDMTSGPILLEAGLRLATKILTSGIISGDQVAVRRIFSLISRPLNEFSDIYYPSFAEWVSSRIKVRLLAAHASLKCYTYAFLRRCHNGVPDENLALLPLFSKSSSILGKYWIRVLKDYGYICFRLHLKKNWKPFLDGIQSSLVSSKLHSCLEESWPVILQAVALDAVPENLDENGSSKSTIENISRSTSISGYSMVKLESEEFRFLWGFALLVLFQRQYPTHGVHIIPLGSDEAKFGGDSPVEETNPLSLKLYEIVLPVFQFLATERFFSSGFLTMDICQEFLQVFSYSIHMDASWNSLAISVLLQIVQNCPEDFLDEDNFAFLAVELCLAYLFKFFHSINAIKTEHHNWEGLISPLFTTAKTLVIRSKPKKQLNLLLAFLLIGYKCIRGASTELCFSKVIDFVHFTSSLLEKYVDEKSEFDDNIVNHLKTILVACLNVMSSLTKDCIEGIHLVENSRPDLCKLLHVKLAFSLEEMILFAKLAHKIGCRAVTKENDTIYFTILKHSTKCIQNVLTDSNMQILVITLQVLKSMAQKSSNAENNFFLVFFVGELFADILTILQTMLKKPITRDSVTVSGECLRILVLLQTLSKPSECQRGLMNLLLEAILLIFLASENDFSQEINDMRSTAVKLVSHLAQIPSSAVHFKDILLAMPLTHRQQLQGMIRASMTPDQNETHKKSTTPSLMIKLPVQTETNTDDIFYSSPTTHTDKNSSIDEEEDDWDAFQSFPASKEPASNINSKVENVPEEPTSAKSICISDANTENDQFEEFSSSSPPKVMKETIYSEHHQHVEEQLLSESTGRANEITENEHRVEEELLSEIDQFEEYSSSSPPNDMKEDGIDAEHQQHFEEQSLSESKGGDTNDSTELPDSQSRDSDVEPCDNNYKERDDRAVARQENDCQVTTDIRSIEDERLDNEVEIVQVNEENEEIPSDTIDVGVPSDLLPLEVVHSEPHGNAVSEDNSAQREQHEESTDNDAGKKSIGENDSGHPHKATVESSGFLDTQNESPKEELPSEIDQN